MALLLQSVAHELYKFKDLGLVIKHIFVIVIHFLQEIHTTDIFLYMMNQFRDLRGHNYLDLVKVLNQGHNKLVTQMQQLQWQLRLRHLPAIENISHHFGMQVGAINNILLNLVGTGPFHCKVNQLLRTQIIIRVGCF